MAPHALHGFNTGRRRDKESWGQRDEENGGKLGCRQGERNKVLCEFDVETNRHLHILTDAGSEGRVCSACRANNIQTDVE